MTSDSIENVVFVVKAPAEKPGKLIVRKEEYISRVIFCFDNGEETELHVFSNDRKVAITEYVDKLEKMLGGVRITQKGEAFYDDGRHDKSCVVTIPG